MDRGLIKTAPPQNLFIEEGFFTDAMKKAANCTKCGDCEERCPYHLPIREMIEEYINLYQIEKKKYQEQIASR